MSNRVMQLLHIDKPVLLAAMTIICDADLSAAVCKAGGLGMLGMNCAVDASEFDPVKNGENLRGAIKKLRSMTDKPFAVNFIPPIPGTDPANDFTAPYKKIIIDEKVPVVLLIGNFDDGNVAPEIESFKKAGVTVVYREISCTVDACVKAAKVGADAIVVTGSEAGGHNSMYNMSLVSILPQVTDALPDVPIIAAGGMVGEKSARAAAAMGAEAAYVGTAFMVAKEGRMHPNYKKAVIEARGEDVLTWRASVARMNTTNNQLGRTCMALAHGGASPLDISRHYAGEHFFASMLHGDVENGCVSVSGAVGSITEERPAKAILDDIAKGFGY